MIRVAAVGDIHYGKSCRGRLAQHLRELDGRADLLLVAGDLTQRGRSEEIRAIAEDLGEAPVPVVSVLGNHDYHSGLESEAGSILNGHGVIVLEGTSKILDIGGTRVGVVGLKGFGGGFGGACATEFGEHETKVFARYAREQSRVLQSKLESLKHEGADFRFVLLHYSPVEGTLLGEKREIYPFLGSYHFAEAIDAVGADGVFHGHAHFGTERATTPGGVPVRNVAQMVIRHAYKVYNFDRGVGETERLGSPSLLER